MIAQIRSILLASACAIFPVALLCPTQSLANSAACMPLDTGLPWNMPPRAEEHSLSAKLSKQLWWEGGDRPGNINMLTSYAAYVAAPDDQLYRVESRRGTLDGELVPFRNGWRTYHSDEQLIVFAPDRHIYELYEADPDHSAHTIKAVRAERLAPDQRFNPPSRGIGIPYVHMLILECEILSGRINHALSLRVGSPKCGEAWFPATKVENHFECTEDGIPIGARFIMRFSQPRIDAWAVRLRKEGGAPLERFGRAVAGALQTYGFFVTDNGSGAAGFDMQHPMSFGSNNPLRDLAVKDIHVIGDLLDGLIAEGDLSLVAETGPRIHDPR